MAAASERPDLEICQERPQSDPGSNSCSRSDEFSVLPRLFFPRLPQSIVIIGSADSVSFHHAVLQVGCGKINVKWSSPISNLSCRAPERQYGVGWGGTCASKKSRHRASPIIELHRLFYHICGLISFFSRPACRS
jgi:hypothetical protein